MKSYDLNNYPKLINQGKLSPKEAVENITSFISKNYKVFNLQRFDEDFRSEVIISLLENGYRIVDSYNPEIGDFFSYIFCYVNSIISTKLKKINHMSLKDTVIQTEGINNLYDKQFKYSTITFQIGEIPKTPYSYKKITPEEIKKIFSNINSENNDKKILVLALKSAFYLTDEQIQKICEMYNIKTEDFYKTIQYFKETLLSKAERRLKAEERRNYAYYHQRKYKLELEKLTQYEDESLYSILSENLSFKSARHKKNWNLMNSRFEKGFLYLRPTTKNVANILGICERQVNYYINCAKKEVEDNKKKKKEYETQDDSE